MDSNHCPGICSPVHRRFAKEPYCFLRTVDGVKTKSPPGAVSGRAFVNNVINKPKSRFFTDHSGSYAHHTTHAAGLAHQETDCFYFFHNRFKIKKGFSGEGKAFSMLYVDGNKALPVRLTPHHAAHHATSGTRQD
jgi:hypothetical protein